MFVARVTVVRKRVMRRESHRDFEPRRLTVSTEHSHLRTRRHPFRFRRPPDELVQVDDALVRTKGKGLGIGPARPLSLDKGVGKDSGQKLTDR
jgi:hypothetical protein